MIEYTAKELSDRRLEEVKREIQEFGYKPRVVIIQANDDNASNLYIKNKIRMCERVGIEATHYKFDETISTADIVDLLHFINSRKETNAILVQLPLFKHLDEQLILQSIEPTKDVDTLTHVNLGKLYDGDMRYLPLTPRGVMEILKDNDIEISGKKVVVIGRSVIAGKSTAMGLLSADATVTICHSKTKDLVETCQKADILVTCIGKQLIDSRYIKEGATVVNVGYAKNLEGKTCGDIFYEDIVLNSKAYLVTKIFNCSGLMTTTMLTERVLELYKEQNNLK